MRYSIDKFFKSVSKTVKFHIIENFIELYFFSILNAGTIKIEDKHIILI